MTEDFSLCQTGPGQESRPCTAPCTARACEHRSHLQSFAAIRQAWTLGGIIDALNNNSPEEAKAIALLALAALDQSAVDAGNWLLAAEFSLENAPPFGADQRSRALEGEANKNLGQPLGQRPDEPPEGKRCFPHSQEESGGARRPSSQSSDCDCGGRPFRRRRRSQRNGQSCQGGERELIPLPEAGHDGRGAPSFRCASLRVSVSSTSCAEVLRPSPGASGRSVSVSEGPDTAHCLANAFQEVPHVEPSSVSEPFVAAPSDHSACPPGTASPCGACPLQPHSNPENPLLGFPSALTSPRPRVHCKPTDVSVVRIRLVLP